MKQISTRFSIAVHTLSLIAVTPDCTGDFIAGSVNTNPVIIRRIMGMLKKRDWWRCGQGWEEPLCSRNRTGSRSWMFIGP